MDYKLNLKSHWNNRRASNQVELKKLSDEIAQEIASLSHHIATFGYSKEEFDYLDNYTSDLRAVSKKIRYNLDSIIERELQQLFNRKDTKAVELTAFYSQHTNSTISDWCEKELGLDATVNQIRKWLYDFDVTTPIEG